mmetsp:Transcript_7220/g.21810  ORF Transcript_7220/g.21810 Transcript_7220/m.21810 type:complete len:345 (+) Transcript_7220:2965-3999(+)
MPKPDDETDTQRKGMQNEVICVTLLIFICILPNIEANQSIVKWRYSEESMSHKAFNSKQICPFSSEFGEYMEVKKRTEYYMKECPFVANRFKGCETRGYSWRPPKDCNLLDIIDFMEYFSNRTLMFWGDSLNEQLAESMMCMLTSRNLWNADGVGNFVASMRKRDYCLKAQNNINICFLYSSRPQKGIERISMQVDSTVVIANFGLHYSIGKKGQNDEDLKEDIKWLSNFLPKVKATFLWRETSVQHFPTKDGTFDYKSKKIIRAKTIRAKCRGFKFPSRGWRNDITTPEMQNSKIKVLKLGKFSSLIPPSLHRGGKDCTHYCNPGVTDDWARIVMNYIYAHKI